MSREADMLDQESDPHTGIHLASERPRHGVSQKGRRNDRGHPKLSEAESSSDSSDSSEYIRLIRQRSHHSHRSRKPNNEFRHQDSTGASVDGAIKPTKHDRHQDRQTKTDRSRNDHKHERISIDSDHDNETKGEELDDSHLNPSQKHQIHSSSNKNSKRDLPTRTPKVQPTPDDPQQTRDPPTEKAQAPFVQKLKEIPPQHAPTSRLRKNDEIRYRVPDLTIEERFENLHVSNPQGIQDRRTDSAGEDHPQVFPVGPQNAYMHRTSLGNGKASQTSNTLQPRAARDSRSKPANRQKYWI